jgi:hypothetical protein
VKGSVAPCGKASRIPKGSVGASSDNRRARTSILLSVFDEYYLQHHKVTKNLVLLTTMDRCCQNSEARDQYKFCGRHVYRAVLARYRLR